MGNFRIKFDEFYKRVEENNNISSRPGSAITREEINKLGKDLNYIKLDDSENTFLSIFDTNNNNQIDDGNEQKVFDHLTKQWGYEDGNEMLDKAEFMAAVQMQEDGQLEEYRQAIIDGEDTTRFDNIFLHHTTTFEDKMNKGMVEIHPMPQMAEETPETPEAIEAPETPAAPEAPEAPETPEATEAPEAPAPVAADSNPSDNEINTYLNGLEGDDITDVSSLIDKIKEETETEEELEDEMIMNSLYAQWDELQDETSSSVLVESIKRGLTTLTDEEKDLLTDKTSIEEEEEQTWEQTLLDKVNEKSGGNMHTLYSLINFIRNNKDEISELGEETSLEDFIARELNKPATEDASEA